MIFACHHKVGTTWFHNILSHIAHEYHLNYQYCQQKDLTGDADIFFDDHSRMNVSLLENYRGVHLIRDPRDVIVSGFHYHKWTAEEWANEPRSEFNGLTYKEQLNSLDDKQGLIFEMNHIGKETIHEMIRWDYDNEDFIEVKYEELLVTPVEIFTAIFKHYNFTPQAVLRCLEIADNYSFKKMKKNRTDMHLRKGTSGDWKNHFDKESRALFKTMFPNVLVSLGYEENDEW